MELENLRTLKVHLKRVNFFPIVACAIAFTLA